MRCVIVPFQTDGLAPIRLPFCGHAETARTGHDMWARSSRRDDRDKRRLFESGLDLEVGPNGLARQGGLQGNLEFVLLACFDFTQLSLEELRFNGRQLQLQGPGITGRDHDFFLLPGRRATRLSEVDALRSEGDRLHDPPFADEDLPGMTRVVGLDGDVPSEVAAQLAALDLDFQILSLAGFDGTVGPTVVPRPSPTLSPDPEVGCSVVANHERESERLFAAPNGFQRRRLLVAGPLGVGIHFKLAFRLALLCSWPASGITLALAACIELRSDGALNLLFGLWLVSSLGLECGFGVLLCRSDGL